MHGPICSECGQKEALPIKANRVLKDIWSQFLELDFKFVRAIRDIIVRPGIMINGYISGKRISYTNPFKLLFFIATAYFLVIQYFDIKIDSFTNSEKDMGRIVAAFLNYTIFLVLIPTAFFYRLLFARKKLNLSESYVSICYLWSGYLIISISVALITLPITQYFVPIKLAFEYFYLVFAIRNVFNLRIIASIVKALLLLLSYFLSTMILISLIILIANLLQYEPLMLNLNLGK